MKRTTIFIDEQLERELQALARRLGRPAAGLVREAVAQYVVAARAARAPRLRFMAAGRSGRADTASRHEELLFADATPPRTTRREPARPRATRSKRRSR